MCAQRAKLYSIPRKLDIPNSTLFIVIKKYIHMNYVGIWKLFDSKWKINLDHQIQECMVFYGETKNRNFLRLIYFHLISYIQTAGRAKFIRTYLRLLFLFISLRFHYLKINPKYVIVEQYATSTPSPRVTRFHVARNSTSAEFLKTALCGIPLQWNSSKSRYAEFQRNSKYSPTNAIFA